jgi:hypothetical protein
MHNNCVEPEVTISRMRIACWINKATDTHTEFEILVAFPLQQWLQKRACGLRYTYICCLVLHILALSGSCANLNKLNWIINIFRGQLLILIVFTVTVVAYLIIFISFLFAFFCGLLLDAFFSYLQCCSCHWSYGYCVCTLVRKNLFQFLF